MTLQVDRRVASFPFPRGVIAVVVECKETGGIIACTEAGIITNGHSKKEWWIPSDGHKLHVNTVTAGTTPPELTPRLDQIRKATLGGTFECQTRKHAPWVMP